MKKIKKLGGHAIIDSLCTVVYLGRRNTTATHELLHGMSLRHTFDDSATFGYKKKVTQNIMDYSATRKSTWLWQWKQLWKSKNLKNE